MNLNNLIQKVFNDKKILILGFGREGKSSLLLIEKYATNATITISDKNILSIPVEVQEKYHCISGTQYTENMKQYDLIVKSPGIPEKVISRIPEEKITSQTDIFLQQYHNQVIGITGTKGKSTTSSLIAHLLTTAGIKNILVGNIGRPPFSVVDDIDDNTMIVMELSAHQLNHLHNAPHISIFLNIFEEHLDHFGSFESYFEAKCNIFRKQNRDDILIVDSSNSLINGKITEDVINLIPIDKEKVKDISTQLQGNHNLTNIAFAYTVANFLQIPDDIIAEGIKTFCPLPHRLEYVGTFDNISFYNDSISTVPEASIAAIDALKDIDTIILGGFDRGISYRKLAKYLVKSSISNVILVGNAGKRIGELLDEKTNNLKIFYGTDMQQIVEIAYKNTQHGKKCLLSPAASSYDQYSNFEERGNSFMDNVRKNGKKAE